MVCLSVALFSFIFQPHGTQEFQIVLCKRNIGRLFSVPKYQLHVALGYIILVFEVFLSVSSSSKTIASLRSTSANLSFDSIGSELLSATLSHERIWR